MKAINKQIVGLAILFMPFTLLGNQVDMSNVRIAVKKSTFTRNPETAAFDKESSVISKEQLQDYLQGAQVIGFKTGYRIGSVGGALNCLAGGDCGGGGGKTLDTEVVNATLLAEDGQLVVQGPKTVSFSKDLVPILAFKEVIRKNSARCDQIKFDGKASSLNTTCTEYIERKLTNHFPDALIHTEMKLGTDYGSQSNQEIKFDTDVVSRCEVGIGISLEKLLTESKSLNESCRTGNFRSCSKEPSLTKTVGRDVKVSLLNRATGEVIETMTTITASGEERETSVSFKDQNGNEILKGTMYSNSLAFSSPLNKECGYTHIKN
jgi:hypothetical protein